MPPKSLPPRRTTRTTARKSILPPVLSRSTLGSSQDSPCPPPPSATSIATAGSTSGLSLNGDGLLTSPDSKYNPKLEKSSPSGKASPAANPRSEPQDKIKKSVARFGKNIRVGDQAQELAVTNLASTGPVSRSCSTQDTISARPKRPAAGGAGAELDRSEGGGSSIVPGAMVVVDAGLEVVKGKGGDEALAEVDKATIEATGSAKAGECRTRKVVKKTVRIVKKIVKRRVPKRVVTGSQRNEETKGVMTALDSAEVEKLYSDVTLEKVDSGGTVVNEEMKSVADVDISKERDKSLKPGMSELNSIEVGTVGHGGTVFMETEENTKISCTAALEIENENLKEIQGHAEEITKISPSVSVETEENSNINCTAALEIGNENLKEIQGHAEQITRINPSTERVVKVENVEELRDSTCGSSSQGFVADENDGNESLMVEDQLENGNLKLVEMKIDDLFEDLSGGSIQEGRPDGEEKNDVGLNGALTLSGEMEALERRKRRRTEIFVGGLDKDANEEDIRKWFEQVGEVKQVRLVKNSDSGKNKGFAFLRFASAADAKKALEKFSTVEIRGKQCGVRPVEGNDTIYLGNINKKWKSEDVVQQLKVAKIQNIDKVIVMANPSNFEQNRGFAFLEFQTSKGAQIAFSKLQKYDVFVKQMKIKVAWAQPLVEPDEEEMLKVKSVYAEYLPASWDEAKARNFFKRFGEIESITLAKNLPSSRRKDFAFVNYFTREAALACIQAFAHEQVDDAGSKVKVKVSLAKPLKKVKQTKQVSGTSGKEHVKEKRMTSNSLVKVHQPLKIEKHTSNNLEGIRVDRTSSTTDELLQLLRQQAQTGQPQPGSFDLNHHYASAGSKRPFSALGNSAIFSEPRGFPHTYHGTSHLHGSTSAFASHVDTVSLPNFQRQRTGYTLESPHGFEKDPHFKTREQATYLGRSGMYQRY